MNFPEKIDLNDISVTVNSPSFYSENRSLQGHARKIPTSRFEVTFKTVSLNPIKARELWGFINALRGRFNPFYIVLPTHSNSLGSIDNTPSVKVAANAGNNTLSLKNLNPNTTGLMVIGDVFKCAGHSKVYVLTQGVDSDSNGHASLFFEPQLQQDVGANELIAVRNVPYKLRLRSEKSVIKKKTSDQGYIAFSFDTVEAI